MSARHESRGRQAKGKQQKKEDMKQSSFCCDLQAKSPAVVEVTGFEPMASWSRTKRATNCATPRNSVLAKYSVFSILQLTARKRASALRAMLLWTRCKQHTVLICYTLSPNCATPKHLPQRNDGIVVVPLSFVVCKKQRKLCRKKRFLSCRPYIILDI